MSAFNIKDTIKYQDKEYEVQEQPYGNQELFIMLPGYNRKPLSEIESECELVKKFYHAMEYAGATAPVLSIAKDKENHIVYLELFGQEDMVKSITSVIMQGRVKMNDHWLAYSGGYFQIHKAGNKRMMKVLEKGIVHAIIYHSPSLKETNFDVLLGTDEKGLMESFSNWMDLTNPMPYPKELTNEIFMKLGVRDLLTELDATGVKAYSLSDDLGLNDFKLLQEIIIEVSVENGVMNKYDESKITDASYPLPESRLLTPNQVEHIYSELKKIPKTYETDSWVLKPVTVKLFGGSIDIYVTERDVSAGTIIDGEVQKQSQCFGYVDLGQGAEWGYLNFDTYIESSVVEMDLYFGTQYIAQDGTLYKEDVVIQKAKELNIDVQEFIKNVGFNSRAIAA